MDNQFSQAETNQNIPSNQAVNTYQKLGPKTFFFYIMDHIAMSLFFLLGTIVVIVIYSMFGSQDFIAPYDYIFNYIILAGFVLFFIAAAIGFLVAYLEYSKFQFMLDSDSFKIRRGVLTAEYISMPYRRIESVDVKQPLIFQLFGVSRITIEMTTDEDSESNHKSNSNDEVLPAIDHELALTIQTELTDRSNVQKMSIQNYGVSN